MEPVKGMEKYNRLLLSKRKSEKNSRLLTPANERKRKKNPETALEISNKEN